MARISLKWLGTRSMVLAWKQGRVTWDRKYEMW
jgi:hypothetical protein